MSSVLFCCGCFFFLFGILRRKWGLKAIEKVAKVVIEKNGKKKITGKTLFRGKSDTFDM